MSKIIDIGIFGTHIFSRHSIILYYYYDDEKYV
jgi:hypothetical protein